MEPTRKQKGQVVAGTVLLSNAVVFLSLGSSRLFKHGSEHIFGLEARTWGFVLLGMSVLGVAAAIAMLAEARKAERD